jgi:hypothetical protein
MREIMTTLLTRRYLITAGILLVGLGSAGLIYLTAENPPDDALYEWEHSKMYRHGLELYGGKMNVLANEFGHWFSGLWHGTSLAKTVSCITLVISFVFFFFTSDLPPDVRGKNIRRGPD